MTISVNSFITDTLNTVDSVIGHFVQTSYQNLVQSNASLITLLFTLYIMLMGYRFLTHTLQADIMTMMRQLIIMLIVYMLVMNWSYYNVFVYNVFTNEPGVIAQVLVNSAGQMTGGESTSQALDAIFQSGMKSASGLFMLSSFSNPQYLIYALLVWLATNILCIAALVIFIYAKMAMAIALALGPIFILFLLWDATRELFNAWLKKCVTFALIPIITSSLLALMLSIINITLPNIQLPPTQQQFTGIAPFLGLTLVTAFLLYQVKAMSAALGGGVNLANLGQAAQMGKNLLQSSGLTNAAKQGATSAKKGVSGAKEKIQTTQQKTEQQAAIARANKKYDGWV